MGRRMLSRRRLGCESRHGRTRPPNPAGTRSLGQYLRLDRLDISREEEGARAYGLRAARLQLFRRDTVMDGANPGRDRARLLPASWEGETGRRRTPRSLLLYWSFTAGGVEI